MLLIRFDSESENVRVSVDGVKGAHVYDAIQLDYNDFATLMKFPVSELGAWFGKYVLGFTVPGLRDDQIRRMGEITRDRTMSDADRRFAQAMYRLGRDARDALGLPIALHVGAFTSEALAESAAKYVDEQLSADEVFLRLASPPADAETKQKEAAAWRNLALLSEAVACAIEAGR